jgi:hypothetical protein
LIALVLNAYFLFVEVQQMLHVQSWKDYWFSLWNYFDLMTHVLVFVVLALHASRSPKQFVVTTITILLAWGKLLFYFRAFRGMGVFVRLIYLLSNQIRYFLLVWLVILFGFANASVILFRDINNHYPSTIGVSLVSVFSELFGGRPVFVTGDDETSEYFDGFSGLYTMQIMVYLAFTFICNLILLNMLIALMGSIFEDVMGRAIATFQIGRAHLILDLETAHPRRPFQPKKRWLVVQAGKDSEYWPNEDNSDVEELKAYQDQAMHRMMSDMKEQQNSARQELEEVKSEMKHLLQKAMDHQQRFLIDQHRMLLLEQRYFWEEHATPNPTRINLDPLSKNLVESHV